MRVVCALIPDECSQEPCLKIFPMLRIVAFVCGFITSVIFPVGFPHAVLCGAFQLERIKVYFIADGADVAEEESCRVSPPTTRH